MKVSVCTALLLLVALVCVCGCETTGRGPDPTLMYLNDQVWDLNRIMWSK